MTPPISLFVETWSADVLDTSTLRGPIGRQLDEVTPDRSIRRFAPRLPLLLPCGVRPRRRRCTAPPYAGSPETTPERSVVPELG